jgi:hypothetical protein
MIYAIDRKGNKIPASAQNEGFCPLCLDPVIPKCGEINIHHWAHRANDNCDDWYEPETDWHLYWKSLVPAEFCEVVIEKDGKRHRADIVTASGIVVELQHSGLSTQQIMARENFYQKMIWLFDVRDCCKKRSLEKPPRLSIRNRGDYYSFRWRHARQHIGRTDFKNIPVYLDIGGERIFKLRQFHSSPPVGGWGYIAEKALIEQWLIDNCMAFGDRKDSVQRRFGSR